MKKYALIALKFIFGAVISGAVMLLLPALAHAMNIKYSWGQLVFGTYIIVMLILLMFGKFEMMIGAIFGCYVWWGLLYFFD